MRLQDKLAETPPLPKERWGDLKIVLRNEALLGALRSVLDLANEMDRLSNVELTEGLIPVAQQAGTVRGLRMVIDLLEEWSNG